ncbi:outer membrane lipoprotein chaperone LolA [Candidatus Njordibacter sp. Uisw_039]|jgi:outer membrane lipoprotein carrier protein|uniref:outer membrane lipoprotein chaperone LolA n=1 Tax=Candidatus Njordibacter sp. Uisw_039 TaxID=3230972 RepID=UPI00359131DD|tara:strand:- start:477 stop:1100 length:624 start_codon:yes stop_codon:yes gene_type:complete
MRLAVFLLSVTLAGASLAQTAAQSLGQQLGRQTNIEADFVQYMLDASGSRLQETHGHMVLSQPNQFWWQTADPFSQLLVSNGKRLWIYDEDLEQVTIQTLDQRATSTPALLLSGNSTDIEAEFNVVMNRGDNGLVFYRLTPRDPESLYQTLRLNFKNNQLLEMQLEDAMQQKTSLTFSNMVFNPQLKEGLFEFVIPEGTDVIEMDQL